MDARHQADRNKRRAVQAAKIIKEHIERGHTCCIDKYKGDLPDNFVRCVDCTKELDKDEEM